MGRPGEVVPYIFCESTKEGDTQADRAFPPDELRRSEKDAETDETKRPKKIDFQFYLSNQILPPVERLCDLIEGTDRARLPQCLGLDPNKYQTYAGGDQEERPFGSLESQVPDKERFQAVRAVPRQVPVVQERLCVRVAGRRCGRCRCGREGEPVSLRALHR